MKTSPIRAASLALLASLCLLIAARGQTVDPLIRERDEQTGTAITILFDNSGSMNDENKITQAKSAFRTWLRTVPADYKFSLITFEDQGRLVVPLGEKTRDIVAERVSKLEARTSTPICGALKIASAQIDKRRREVTPYERHVVLVFTDGQENQDPRGIDGVRVEIKALRAKNVEVVGIGFHGEGDYMDGVATRFALAGDERELSRGLAKVDAETGGADDVVVSEEDLAALRKFRAPAAQPVMAAAAEPAPGETAVPPAAAVASPPPAPQESGSRLGWIITGVIIWMVVRAFTRAKKRSR
jgi:Mg-chelatase subunit ChlD